MSECFILHGLSFIFVCSLDLAHQLRECDLRIGFCISILQQLFINSSDNIEIVLKYFAFFYYRFR